MVGGIAIHRGAMAGGGIMAGDAIRAGGYINLPLRNAQTRLCVAIRMAGDAIMANDAIMAGEPPARPYNFIGISVG